MNTTISAYAPAPQRGLDWLESRLNAERVSSCRTATALGWVHWLTTLFMALAGFAVSAVVFRDWAGQDVAGWIGFASGCVGVLVAIVRPGTIRQKNWDEVKKIDDLILKIWSCRDQESNGQTCDHGPLFAEAGTILSARELAGPQGADAAGPTPDGG